MKPDINVILTETEDLKNTLLYYGNDELNGYDKQILSKKLAELVEKVRIKYELVSGFYFFAECSAKKKVHDLYGEDLK